MQRFCDAREQSGSEVPEDQDGGSQRTQADEVGGEETPVGTKQSEIDLYPII